MRAPPELVTETSGTPRSIAESQARENFSPTALPIEPPMNAEVHHRELDRMAVDRRLADHHRLAETGVQLRLGEALGVRTQVEEVERVVRADVRPPPRRTSPRRRTSRCARGARIGKWWPQWPHTQSAAASSSSR